ncbi:MAG: hypothetical protein H7X95_13285 [Deltaproteobacteria bacterium]|nr:hypothetical protein [Deltaproteobacteria bacterium]
MSAHPDGLTLDELSEELVTKPVTYGDIDELIGALEAAGVNLEGPEPAARPDDLARVLATVRALTTETGKRPSADEIARRSGLTSGAVLRALQLGRSA